MRKVKLDVLGLVAVVAKGAEDVLVNVGPKRDRALRLFAINVVVGPGDGRHRANTLRGARRTFLEIVAARSGARCLFALSSGRFDNVFQRAKALVVDTTI